MSIAKWLKGAVLAVLVSVGFSANAGVITDVVEVDTYVGWWESTSWTHDLNDDGFTLGSAQSATLTIEFWDDDKKLWDLGELATIVVGTIDFLDGAFIYVPTTDWSGALGLNSLASLNANGLLSVKVWSDFGDFFVGNSTLEVVTASVPEPSALMLLALGLLGLVAARKQRA